MADGANASSSSLPATVTVATLSAVTPQNSTPQSTVAPNQRAFAHGLSAAPSVSSSSLPQKAMASVPGQGPVASANSVANVSGAVGPPGQPPKVFKLESGEPISVSHETMLLNLESKHSVPHPPSTVVVGSAPGAAIRTTNIIQETKTIVQHPVVPAAHHHGVSPIVAHPTQTVVVNNAGAPATALPLVTAPILENTRSVVHAAGLPVALGPASGLSAVGLTPVQNAVGHPVIPSAGSVAAAAHLASLKGTPTVNSVRTKAPETKIVHQPVPLPAHQLGAVATISGVAQSTPSLVISSAGTPNAAQTAAQTATQQQFQRLKVEDALSYLDQVKFRFNNQPQVYNDFLDIMKEFKSQSIDTPGVIQRVSNLFKGHPELIVGFNTFLPPGYKIEMNANEQVSVSMPSSTVIIQSSGMTTINPNNVPIHYTTTPPTPQQTNAVAPNFTAAGLSHALNTVQPLATTKLTFNTSTVANAVTAVPRSVPVEPPQQVATSVAVNHVTAVANNSIQNVAAAAANGTANSGTQPEFNHAINYVNKIKSRFNGQPEIYKKFLEILHAYQKEQKNIKEGRSPENKQLSESEVYAQVKELFQNNEDLLREFGQFLPDATGGGGSASVFSLNHPSLVGNALPMSNLPHGPSNLTSAISVAQHSENLAAANRAANNDHGAIVKKPLARAGNAPGAHFNQNSSNLQGIQAMKRTASSQQFAGSMNKRPRMTSLKDVSMAEAGKYGSLNEFAFFDKVRKALRSPEVYDNFLRCLVMYNTEIVSRSELVLLMTPFLTKFPELLKWLKEFLGCKGDGSNITANTIGNNNNNVLMEGLPQRVIGIRERERERLNSEVGMEIDYATCKRYGASYRALPKNFPQPKCTGRTQLCREVLNDTWVSFPSWSEDSTFVTSKKTQYEEYISKCEDERFELDVVIETNLTTIRVLESVQKRLSRLTPDERNKYKLDDNLGGTSTVIHQRSIRRIYGDKAPEIIEGLKKNPAVAVPLVLRRLKLKEEEWREAQKSFNKIWREQNERYYLKSLDHQGISFKQNDIKNLRSKNLLSEIEALFDEHHERSEEQAGAGDGNNVVSGPHITLNYKDKSMIEEACNLIIHHVKRQTSIHKEDKQKIKQLMKHFIPDLFSTPRGELSDDEFEDMDYERDEPPKPKKGNGRNGKNGNGNGGATSAPAEGVPPKIPPPKKPTTSDDGGESYALFYVNNYWYLFFRLHAILCERLGKMYERARIIAAEEAKEKTNRKESTAIALRLKPKSDIDIEEYFPAFVDMIKNVLDGNLDGNQYEDMLREMFGIYAYIGFTMDKVVQNIVRQLQHIVCDDSSSQCTTLYIDEGTSTEGLATGGPVLTQHLRAVQETTYQKKSEQLLAEENCFKLMVYRPEGKVTIELLDTDSSESEDGGEIERWSEYIEKYVREDDTISDELKERLSKKPVFLPRNIPSWRLKADLKSDEELNEAKQERDKIVTRNSALNSNNNNGDGKDKSKDGDQSKEKGGSDDGVKDVEMTDETQCRFNVNNYKMVFVVESESYIYRRMSIKKARLSHKRISQRLYNRFNTFHSKWLSKGDRESRVRAEEWMSGVCYDKEAAEAEKNAGGDQKSSTSATGSSSAPSSSTPSSAAPSSTVTRTRKRTVTMRIDDDSKSPYRPFCRYKFE